MGRLVDPRGRQGHVPRLPRRPGLRSRRLARVHDPPDGRAALRRLLHIPRHVLPGERRADPVDRQRAAALPVGAPDAEPSRLHRRIDRDLRCRPRPRHHRLGSPDFRRRGRLQRGLGRASAAHERPARRHLYLRPRRPRPDSRRRQLGDAHRPPLGGRGLGRQGAAARRGAVSPEGDPADAALPVPAERPRAMGRGGRRRLGRGARPRAPAAGVRGLRRGDDADEPDHRHDRVRLSRHPVALPGLGADPHRRGADARPANARGPRGGRARRTGPGGARDPDAPADVLGRGDAGRGDPARPRHAARRDAGDPRRPGAGGARHRRRNPAVSASPCRAARSRSAPWSRP